MRQRMLAEGSEGSDAVRAQLEELPRAQRVDVVRAIRDSS